MSNINNSQKAQLLRGKAFDYLEVSKQPVETSMSNSVKTTSACDAEKASADLENKPNQAAAAGIQMELGGSDRRIEIVPLNRLVPYKSNARTHSKKQIRQIADSIERFGFTNPVLIDHANQIIAGHGRVEAAKLDRKSVV